MSALIKKIALFAGLFALLLAAGAVLVALSGGSVRDPDLGWAEFGGIATVLTALAVIVGGLAFVTFGNFTVTEGAVLVTVGTIIVVLIGLIGLVWLRGPLSVLLTSPTLWWVVGTLVVTVAAWKWPRA